MTETTVATVAMPEGRIVLSGGPYGSTRIDATYPNRCGALRYLSTNVPQPELSPAEVIGIVAERTGVIMPVSSIKK